MATFSKKMGGKEVGDAAVYAKPHTMTGESMTIDKANAEGPDKRSSARDVNMSVGSINRSPYPPAKTSGIKTRGNGAATKGTMARGPMA
jgi:hypothetical protein